MIGAHEPVGNIYVVRAPVGDQAAAVLVPRAEAEAARLESPLGRRTLPHVPVETGRNRLLGLLGTRVRPGLHDADVGDVAQDAAVDDLLGLGEMIPASLLRADLDDLFALLIGVEHRVEPHDRVGRRLLDIDVLARRDRIDGLLRVPVVGRRDEDRIDVLAVEDAAMVADHVELEGLPRRVHPLIELGLVDFRGGQELAVGMARERVEHAAATVPTADDRHPHAAICALYAEQRLCRRHRQRRGRGLQELAPALHYRFSFSLNGPAAAREPIRVIRAIRGFIWSTGARPAACRCACGANRPAA